MQPRSHRPFPRASRLTRKTIQVSPVSRHLWISLTIRDTCKYKSDTPKDFCTFAFDSGNVSLPCICLTIVSLQPHRNPIGLHWNFPETPVRFKIRMLRLPLACFRYTYTGNSCNCKLLHSGIWSLMFFYMHNRFLSVCLCNTCVIPVCLDEHWRVSKFTAERAERRWR